MIPELSLNFDIGRCVSQSLRQDNLAVSHGHIDHMAGLAYYVCTRQFYGMPAPRIFLPDFLLDPVDDLLRLWERIQGFEIAATLLPMTPGTPLALRRDLFIEALPVQHRLPAYGYVVSTKRTKLKPEFVGLPQQEIVRLKADGQTELFYEQVHPLVGYSGDTLIDAIDQHPVFYRCKYLILEATFLDERRNGWFRARRGGHVHLDEIVARAARFENQALILIHASQAYRPHEVAALIDERCPPALRGRVHILR